MDVIAAFTSLGIALGLGLLVGIQRQRADSALAGVRTFPLITIFGVVCAMLSDALGTWLLPAGLLAVTAAATLGNRQRRGEQEQPGITTEIAILLMYAVGGLLWLAPQQIGVAVGVGCAVLLHLKPRLHRWVARLTDLDLWAVMQFAVISLVVLPVLPDRTFGPLDVLNPRQIWWMVVLVVGLSLAAYVVYKLLPKASGALVTGVLGGLISSTATTVSFARRARSLAQPADATAPALAIALASAIVFVRISAEIGIAAGPAFPALTGPLWVLFAASLVGAAILWASSRARLKAGPDPTNPTELRSALTFAALYALVIFLVAAAQKYLGSQGIYAVAALSGLTDMDAITLSTSRLVVDGKLDAATAWRAIVLASLANVVFKAAVAWAIGGRSLFLKLLIPTVVVLLTGLGLIIAWPA